jgi:hypothetical protein
MATRTRSEAAIVASVESCPVCAGPRLSTIVDLPQLPALVCSEFLTALESRRSPKGDVLLCYCHDCGLIFNQRYEQSNVRFLPGYSASLAHTDSFRAHIGRLANRLIEHYDLRDKTVLEIGCGDGFFLRQICSLGGNRGVGVDPTIAVDSLEQCGEGSVHLIGDSFTVGKHGIAADLICSISVFETLSNPKGLLLGLRELLEDHPKALLYFEVPNASSMFERNAIWSIYYEQYAHFTDKSLRTLFELCGFDVLRAAPCYADGQYLFIEARPRPAGSAAAAPALDDNAVAPEGMASFAKLLASEITRWKRILRDFEQHQEKVVLWGSGGKGNTFVSLVDDDDLVRYVVDINPKRHGKFLPGTGKQIVAPEFLLDYRPNTIIVTNSIYESDIRNQVRSLGLSCEFLTL